MELYESEQDQVDALKKWWKDNGTTTLIGVALGLGVVFGWTGWQQYQTGKAEAASAIFDQQRQAVVDGDFQRSAELTAQLVEEHGGTNYATLASLLMAKLAHDTDNLDDARRQLQWVLEKSDQPELALTARLRLARLNLSAGDPDGALTLLESAEPGAFAAAFDEVKGDVHVAKSNIDRARAAYERSLEASDGGALRERIQMKLDDLGHLNFQPEGS